MIADLLGAAVLAAAPPQISLVATPARVQLEGAERATVVLSNHGRTPLVVDATRAGFTISLRGRPRVLAAPRGRTWLAFSPRRLRIAAGRSAAITVSAHAPRGSTPGDHPALLLLTTRPRHDAGLAIRMRVGVVVLLRVPGHLVHRLQPTGVVVRRQGPTRTLELELRNGGNVTEVLPPGRLTVTLWRGAKMLARFRPPPRELLPRTRAVVELRYRGRGPAVARVELRGPGPGARTLRRSYRIRL